MMRLAGMGLVVAVCLTLGTPGARAADDKQSATGTWKWSFTVNDQKRDFTVKLKQEGEKLTGNMIGRDGNEIPIKEGTVKDGEVSFKVTRERNGQEFTITYKGKLSGDAIKGKAEAEINGQTRRRDWEAKREK